jgi:hypothetical protein
MTDLGPKYVNATEVPPLVLRGIVRMGRGGKRPGGTLWDDMCEWADQHGGDVIIEFDEGHPIRRQLGKRGKGYVLHGSCGADFARLARR